MNNQVTIQASDGKVFTGNVDNYVELYKRLEKYENELKAKKEKEDTFKKEKYNKLVELNKRYKEFCKLYEEYERNTGETLYVSFKDGSFTIKEVDHDNYFSRYGISGKCFTF